jgi:predicted AAA+ superfamily ATPase
VAGKAGLANRTVARYVSLLQEIFLIKLIPAGSRNLSTRVTGTPKVAMTDSGIAANLVGADKAQFKRPGSSLGPLLEGFVLMELARQQSWNDTRRISASAAHPSETSWLVLLGVMWISDSKLVRPPQETPWAGPWL